MSGWPRTGPAPPRKGDFMKIRLVRGSHETARGRSVGRCSSRRPPPRAAQEARSPPGKPPLRRHSPERRSPANPATCSTSPAPGLPVKHVLFVGIGKPEDLTLDRVRQAAGGAARAAQDRGLARISTDIADLRVKSAAGGSPADLVQAVSEGAPSRRVQVREIQIRKKNGNRPSIRSRFFSLRRPPGDRPAPRTGAD